MAQTAKPYATVPTLFEKVQDEIAAIEQIMRVLGSLPDHDTRVRVIGWLSERFSQGFQQPHPTTVGADGAAARRAADSGLTIPDDLFEAVETPEPADLHGVFDPPEDEPQLAVVANLHKVATERPQAAPPGERAPLLMVVKTETAMPLKAQPPVRDEPQVPAVAQPHDVFELVPPREVPQGTDPEDDDAPEAPQRNDGRQLRLLLLANMTTPAALIMRADASSDDSKETPVPKPQASPRSRARTAETRVPHKRSAAENAPAREGALKNATPAVTAATDAPTAVRRAAPRRPQPAAAPGKDSMETMLRGLVADFRELADEWGNT